MTLHFKCQQVTWNSLFWSHLDNETVFLIITLLRLYFWYRWHVLFLALELILLLLSAVTSSLTAVRPLIHFAHHWHPHSISLLLQNSLFHDFDSLSSIYQLGKSVFRTLKVIYDSMISRFLNRKAPATDTFINLKASLDLKVVWCFFPASNAVKTVLFSTERTLSSSTQLFLPHVANVLIAFYCNSESPDQ